MQFKTSAEDDEALLALSSWGPAKRSAIILRMREKQVCVSLSLSVCVSVRVFVRQNYALSMLTPQCMFQTPNTSTLCSLTLPFSYPLAVAAERTQRNRRARGRPRRPCYCSECRSRLLTRRICQRQRCTHSTLPPTHQDEETDGEFGETFQLTRCVGSFAMSALFHTRTRKC